MKNTILIIFLSTIFVTLFSINSFPLNNPVILNENDRDTTIKYHNDSVDQLWAGADFWAVKFDFSGDDIYSQIDTFTVQQANIYLYELPASDTLRVYLHYDEQGQPEQNPIEIVDIINPQIGDNTVTFQNEYTSDKFWLAVKYETSLENRIAGSAIDGSHSYYGILNNSEMYYYNMEANGYQSELIFSITGITQTSGLDIELTSATISNTDVGDAIHVDAKITNNSAIATDCNLRVEFLYSTIDSLMNISYNSIVDTFAIPSILPNNFYEDTFINSQMIITDKPQEYKVKLAILAEDDVTYFNNQKEILYSNYVEENPKVLIENFVTYNESSLLLWNDQEEIIDENASVLNYFSDSIDSLYTPECVDRFNYYDLFGYPTTVISGTTIIYGYEEDTYSDKLQNNLTNSKTFIIDETTTNSVEIVSENIVGSITLQNNGSFMPVSAEVTLYCALAENLEYEESIFGDVLKQLITIQDDITLDYGEHYSVDFQFDYSDLSLSHDVLNPNERENFKIIYWLQNNDSNQIYFSNSFSLDEVEVIVSNQNDVEQISNISIFPNPTKDFLNISINNRNKNEYKNLQLQIFNIKGQLVDSHQFPSYQRKQTVSLNDANLASGIYFIKTKISYRNSTHNELKKILYIK